MKYVQIMRAGDSKNGGLIQKEMNRIHSMDGGIKDNKQGGLKNNATNYIGGSWWH